MKMQRNPGQQSIPHAVAAMVAIVSPASLSETTESGGEGVKTKIPTLTPTNINRPTSQFFNEPSTILSISIVL
jgi:hypothetical protein